MFLSKKIKYHCCFSVISVCLFVHQKIMFVRCAIPYIFSASSTLHLCAILFIQIKTKSDLARFEIFIFCFCFSFVVLRRGNM